MNIFNFLDATKNRLACLISDMLPIRIFYNILQNSVSKAQPHLQAHTVWWKGFVYVWIQPGHSTRNRKVCPLRRTEGVTLEWRPANRCSYYFLMQCFPSRSLGNHREPTLLFSLPSPVCQTVHAFCSDRNVGGIRNMDCLLMVLSTKTLVR